MLLSLKLLRWCAKDVDYRCAWKGNAVPSLSNDLYSHFHHYKFILIPTLLVSVSSVASKRRKFQFPRRLFPRLNYFCLCRFHFHFYFLSGKICRTRFSQCPMNPVTSKTQFARGIVNYCFRKLELYKIIVKFFLVLLLPYTRSLVALFISDAFTTPRSINTTSILRY